MSRVLPGHRRGARDAPLPDRRRRVQSRRYRAAAPARLRIACAALGHRTQVRRRGGAHHRARHRVSSGPHRCAHAGRAPRADVRGRCHGEQRHLAQHRRNDAQGRAGRRYRGDSARGRRHSRGGARAARAPHRRRAGDRAADALPRVRVAGGARVRPGGRPLQRRQNLPGAAQGGDQALRLATGARHSGSRRQAGRAARGSRLGEDAGRSVRARARAARDARAHGREIGAESSCRRSRRQAHDVAAIPVCAGDPRCRRGDRARARPALRRRALARRRLGRGDSARAGRGADRRRQHSRLLRQCREPPAARAAARERHPVAGRWSGSSAPEASPARRS